MMKLYGGRSRCGRCGLGFTSTSAFDGHRAGPFETRRCLSAVELRSRGWRPNTRGFWRVPAPPEAFTKYAAKLAARIEPETA